MLRIACVLAVVGCYREQAAPPPANVGVPMEQQQRSCGADDRTQPVVDTGAGLRLRVQSEGPLTGWRPLAAPAFVPPAVGSMMLFLLDRADGGYLALYRDPYNRGSCDLSGNGVCAYEAHHYDEQGRLKWRLRLDELMSRKSHLEIQDIRLAGGVLYFNEACQGYSRNAKGKCSSLVAVDPHAQRVKWRTRSLVSNGRIALAGCYVIAGYGFTSEADALHLVDRATGKIVQQLDVRSVPQSYRLQGDEVLVELSGGATWRYRMRGFDGPSARLEELDDGGSGYGGIGYGGTHGTP